MLTIDEAYKILESVSDGKPFDVNISCNNFYGNEPRKRYSIYIENVISINGANFEECFNQFVVLELKPNGHYYKKIVRDHKKKLDRHKILFRKF